MASKRDVAAAVGNADLAKILDMLLDIGRQYLDKYDMFDPFGGAVDASGELSIVGLRSFSEMKPLERASYFQELRDGLRARAEAGEIRAGGLCIRADLRSGGKSKSVIHVSLDSAAGDAAEAYQPYSVTQSGQYTFRKVTIEPGQRGIFT